MYERAKSDAPMVQLATRIPRSLLLKLRLWAVRNEVSMMEFIEAAIRERLERAAKK